MITSDLIEVAEMAATLVEHHYAGDEGGFHRQALFLAGKLYALALAEPSVWTGLDDAAERICWAAIPEGVGDGDGKAS